MKIKISNRGWVLVAMSGNTQIWRMHDKVLNRRARIRPENDTMSI